MISFDRILLTKMLFYPINAKTDVTSLKIIRETKQQHFGAIYLKSISYHFVKTKK